MGLGWRFWLSSEPSLWNSPQQHISSRFSVFFLCWLLWCCFLNMRLPVTFKDFIAPASYLQWTLPTLPPGNILICLQSTVITGKRSYQSSREQNAFYHLFCLTCWDGSSICVSFPYIFLHFIWFGCFSLTHSICCLPYFVLQSVYFFITASLPRAPFRVLYNVHFSILIFWEVFNLPICYQSFKGNHMKEINNMFLLNTVQCKSNFSFTAVND